MRFFGVFLLVAMFVEPESNERSLPPGPADGETEVVVLLHGLGRTPLSMRRMEAELKEAGFRVINHGYPSRDASIDEITEENIKPLMNEIADAGVEKVHFVTHSMGGILVRHYAKEYGAERIGRVVMLAPPNHGSEVADNLKGFAPYQWYFGPAGSELGTERGSVPAGLPSPDFEAGVIAGTRTWNPAFSTWLPGDDDGTVSVESAKLEGMRDFRKVSATHGFIMRNDDAIELVKRFLETGAF